MATKSGWLARRRKEKAAENEKVPAASSSDSLEKPKPDATEEREEKQENGYGGGAGKKSENRTSTAKHDEEPSANNEEHLQQIAVLNYQLAEKSKHVSQLRKSMGQFEKIANENKNKMVQLSTRLESSGSINQNLVKELVDKLSDSTVEAAMSAAEVKIIRKEVYEIKRQLEIEKQKYEEIKAAGSRCCCLWQCRRR